MNGIDKTSPVSLHRCVGYEVDRIEECIKMMLDELGIADMFDRKRVVIKPNLVMKKSADAAATTHPAVLEAMLRILAGRAESVTIAESPPGLYTEAALASFFKVCGITEVAEKYGAKLNFDTSVREVVFENAHTAKGFSLITPLLDADVIVNLAKLKSHALTRYSGAVKNFYGAIPGLDKVETHARFPGYEEFGSMLVDLCSHFAKKPIFNLLDGILAMEGNGPTGGEPRRLDCLIAGVNPFNVDVIGAAIIGFDGVIMLDDAKSRGLTDDADKLTVIGDSLDALRVDDFKRPDSVSGIDRFNHLFGGRLKDFLTPKPIVDRSICIGCGACARSCPKTAIEILDKDGKKCAKIDKKSCIRCFCCQELCPIKAVKIKKNPILRIARL